MKPRVETDAPLPAAPDICRLPAVELARLVAGRSLSVVEVMTAFLDRIEACNPPVNAIVSLRDRGDLIAEAEMADRRLARDEHVGPLFGLPVAIKDLALTKGLRTTFGSPIHANFVPDEDDIFVERMKAAGAIVIGKTNVPEFGFGSQSYNPVFGTTRNALDRRLTAGGSSGGAAVATALQMVPLADGSDMGGSLRNPAGWNAIYGFRPSQGRVPGHGQEVFLSQMGVEGPMARTVEDLALLLGVQAGHDPRAPLSLHGGEDYRNGVSQPIEVARIGFLGDLAGHLPMEDGVLALCRAALGRLEAAGCVVEEIEPGFDPEPVWRAFVTLRHATSGSALKVHYDDPAQRELLKPEARWEVEGALRLTAPEIYAASTVRTNWYRTACALFDRYDFLAMPTAQVFAFDADIHWPTEIAGRKMDSYHRWMEVTAFATMAGLPAIAVPAGLDSRGRSMGLQLIGRPRADLDTLRIARLYERASG